MRFREWAQKRSDRKGTMVSEEELAEIIKYVRNPGYASVYSFSKSDADQIKEAGHSQGFNKYTPGADCLSIDLDDKGQSLDHVLEKFSEYEYEVWFSGCKGHHVIIKHDFIESEDLPYSHLNVVRSFNIKVDECIYQPGRILRLPNAIHEKTGKKKVLIGTNKGKLLEIPLIKKPPVTFSFKGEEEGDYKTALAKLWSLSVEGLQEGERNKKIWQISSELLRAGFNIDAVFHFILHINNKQIEPLDEAEVRAAVISAGRSYARS